MPQLLSTSTGSLAVSAGAQAVSLECTVTQIQVNAGSAAATLSVYDGTSTSGLLLATLQTAANTTLVAPINVPVVANKGVFYVLSGTGATAVIHYSPST